MRSGLAYSSARILLLVVALIVLYLAGARGIVLLALALLLSGLASYVLLSRQRDIMSSALVRRLGKTGEKGEKRVPRKRWGAEFRARLEEGARAEDDDEARVAAGRGEGGSPQVS